MASLEAHTSLVVKLLVVASQMPDWTSLEMWRNFGTLASAIAAWCALIISLFNLWIQSKSLKLNESKEARQASSISFYVRSRSVEIGEHESVYRVNGTITNKSEIANSVPRISLAISYSSAGLGQSEVFISSYGSRSTASPDGETIIPVKIGPRDTVAVMLSFPVKSEILRGAAPKNTWIVLEDADGIELKMDVGF